MSTTTEILFNSPALHSLKRDQLIKLCKVHSIKASGKNTELIEKLKRHAETLPRDSPLSVAARSEGLTGRSAQLPEESNDEEIQHDSQVSDDDQQTANARWGFQMPRPSEQWEVVMESITEEEERSSRGTLNSIRTVGSNNGTSGEFGTGLSKSSSVSSSIKALASSLGWKRDNTSKSALASSSSFPPPSSKLKPLSSKADNELIQHSMPYSSLPESAAPPQTDHFTFDHDSAQGLAAIHASEKTSPLPGHTLRPGMPAPMNARLSLGLNAPLTPTREQQPTTTIRLISNPLSHGPDSPYGRTPQLKPFKTNFDLVLGSPGATYDGFDSVSVWPNYNDRKNIYPPLPFDAPTATATSEVSGDETMQDQSLPGAFSTVFKSPFSARSPPAATTQLSAPEPFVFGSPLPQHNVSADQFKSAASSVLAEMNKRLEAEGIAGVGTDLISKLKPGAHAEIVPGLGAREVNDSDSLNKKNVFKEKFDEIHAEEFSKMEGIDSLVRRKAMAGKGGADSAAASRKNRKSSVGHGAGRDRFGRRIGGDRTSGRLSAANIVGNKKKPRVIPGSFDDADSDDEDEAKENYSTANPEPPSAMEKDEDENVNMENGNKEMDEQEEKERKEKEAVRRKLELNRAKRRSSVGGRGRVSVGRGGVLVKPQPAPKPSRFGFLSSAKSLVQKVWNGGKAAAAPSTAAASGIPKPSVKPPLAAPKQQSAPATASKRAPPPGKSRPSVAPRPPGRVSSLRVDKEKTTTNVASTSSRARSPVPPFGPTSSSTRSSLAAKAHRGSSITGTVASAKSGLTAEVSSVGTRSSSMSSVKTASSGDIGSMGLKKPSTGAGNSGIRSGATSVSSSGSNSSRLSSRLSSSRLLAPTASSLAKTARPSNSGFGSGSNLKKVAEAASKNQKQQGGTRALGMITNNPALDPGQGPWSPRRGGIFSQPLTSPSGIPSPVKRRPAEETAPAELSEPGGRNPGGDSFNAASMKSTASRGLAPTRQRSTTGRKPRISRSKVIARLASQRAASGGAGVPGATGGGTPLLSRGAGRTRSSLGAKVQQRSSFGGKLGGASKTAGEGVLLSAKKRARQSEYARRRSRVTPVGVGASTSANDMEVDAT